MNGNTLANVRAMLKAELGFADVASAVEDKALNQLLENWQIWLASEFDWPFLRHRWDVGITAGGQYQNWATTTAEAVDPLSAPIEASEAPTHDLDISREVRVDVKYNLKWEPVAYGIGPDEYNIWDPAQNQANDPVQRWQYYDQTKFEVWPTPVTVQTMRFIGQRYPITLRNADGTFNDAATFDLDDLLVVLYTAAERLLRSSQPDAQLKQQRAVERLQKLRGNLPSRTRRLVFGNDKVTERELRKVVPIIGVHG